MLDHPSRLRFVRVHAQFCIRKSRCIGGGSSSNGIEAGEYTDGYWCRPPKSTRGWNKPQGSSLVECANESPSFPRNVLFRKEDCLLPLSYNRCTDATKPLGHPRTSLLWNPAVEDTRITLTVKMSEFNPHEIHTPSTIYRDFYFLLIFSDFFKATLELWHIRFFFLC